MLARPGKLNCVECGLPFGAPTFHYYHGDIDNGAAYWSDRGLLCSPQCSLTHFRRRTADGTLPAGPAPDPFEIDLFRR